jgi:hypothetical protein
LYRNAIFFALLFHASAQAQPVKTNAAPAMVKILSHSAMVGIKLSARPESSDSKEDAAIKGCVQALDDSVFNDVMEAFLVRRFSKTELDLMNEFMSTSAGVKYAKNRILFAAQALDAGTKPEPLAQLTNDEVAVINRFLATPLGVKMSSKDGFFDDAVEKAMTARGIELFDGCVTD